MSKFATDYAVDTDDMFSFDAPSTDSYDDKILIVDWSNMMYRSVFATIFGSPEDNFDFQLTKHNLLASFFNTIQKFDPNRVIVAMDSKSWRYDIYPDYKANRKNRSTGKVQLNHERFSSVMRELNESMKVMFSNIMFLQVPRAEADDIIAVMCNEIYKNSQVTIVSSDSDLTQLTTNKNIKQWDLIKQTYLKPINPAKQLEIKILSGDSSDNITGIRRLVGPVKAEKILTEGIESYINSFSEPERTDVENKYKLNRQLIDLTLIPSDIKTSIKSVFESYKTSPIDSQNVTPFFLHNKMKKHLEDWYKISNLIKSLS